MSIKKNAKAMFPYKVMENWITAHKTGCIKNEDELGCANPLANAISPHTSAMTDKQPKNSGILLLLAS